MPRMKLEAERNDGRTQETELTGSVEDLEEIRRQILDAHRTGQDRLIRIQGTGSSTRFWLASRITEVGDIEP